MLDKKIVKLAAGGDRNAFEHIYNETFNYVYSVVFKVLRNESDTGDVVQDVYISLYRNLSKFAFKSDIKTWIYRIAYNKAADYCKKRKSFANAVKAVSDNGEFFFADTFFGDDDREREIKLLYEVVDMLPSKYKEYVVMKDFEGKSYEEIAETFSENVNTVKTRVKRGRQKITELFMNKSGRGEL